MRNHKKKNCARLLAAQKKLPLFLYLKRRSYPWFHSYLKGCQAFPFLRNVYESCRATLLPPAGSRMHFLLPHLNTTFSQRRRLSARQKKDYSFVPSLSSLCCFIQPSFPISYAITMYLSTIIFKRTYQNHFVECENVITKKYLFIFEKGPHIPCSYFLRHPALA